MPLTGEHYWTIGTDPNGKITAAVVDAKRVSLDWKQGEDNLNVVVTSEDGEHFSGSFVADNQEVKVALTLYKNKTGYLLFGTWHEQRTGDEGTWVFRLQGEQR